MTGLATQAGSYPLWVYFTAFCYGRATSKLRTDGLRPVPGSTLTLTPLSYLPRGRLREEQPIRLRVNAVYLQPNTPVGTVVLTPL